MIFKQFLKHKKNFQNFVFLRFLHSLDEKTFFEERKPEKFDFENCCFRVDERFPRSFCFKKLMIAEPQRFSSHWVLKSKSSEKFVIIIRLIF